MQLVLRHQAGRVAVDQREGRNLLIGRRPAQTDDIGKEQRVLGDPGREEQIRRGQRICRVVHIDIAFPPLGELRRHRRVHADRHAVAGRVLEGRVDLLADRLAPIGALALVGNHRLRPGHLRVVLLPVLIDEHLDALHPRFRLREHRARLQIGDALLERGDLLQQFLTLAFSGGGRGRRIERDIELLLPVLRDLDTAAPERRQPRRGGRDRVLAHWQRAKRIRALRVGRRHELRTVLLVDGRDLGVRAPPHPGRFSRGPATRHDDPPCSSARAQPASERWHVRPHISAPGWPPPTHTHASDRPTNTSS